MSLDRLRRILVVLLLVQLETSWTRAKPQQIKPGCRYEGRRYQEGTPVITSEPCLQCRCIEGALRCRLRVCPRLPNPPPFGCRVRSSGENVCCPELVCGETRDSVNMLRRSNIHVEHEERNEQETEHQNTRFQGCLHEGVKYGPGSAMMGSRRCEYCYCISGARRCIRPKCLLPLPGCTPLYAPQSCCPVSYNCTHLQLSTTAPTTGNGCRVGSKVYEEGEMVRDIERKAACDNCFCAMGAVRCVPLACAPPLQGCSPIVREGQCCPSTYNCSGSIEVKATQNYASYAFISKDYAKFRKETNFFTSIDQITNPSVEGRGHRVVEEPIESSTKQHDYESSIVTDSTFSWPSTYETDPMDNEILETVEYVKSSPEIVTTTHTSSDEWTTSMESTTLETSSAGKEDEPSTSDWSTIFTTSTVDSSTVTTIEDLSSMDDTTTKESTTLLTETSGNDTVTEGTKGIDATVRDKNTISSGSTNDELQQHLENVNSTVDPTVGTESTANGSSVSKTSSTVLMLDDILVMNVTVKTNVSVGHIQGVTINPVRSIPPDVEAILNITHRQKGDDYDYDYSEPTLPPSLPNVRIIPFVAADALVKDKTVPSPVTGYPSGSVVVPPELRPTDTSGFYDIATQENKFSPPVETEGGFVPREPPYFDTSYHSTDLNLEIGTGVTVVPAPITSSHPKSDGNSCLFESVEYRHGEILPSNGICVVCMCYYGEVVCSTEKCTPLKIGCRRINTEETCCGKIVCVEAEESPTLVLDRADATAPSLHQPIVSPDPFRDVIKTEPAPDLPSLIEDMIPYLVEHGITTPATTTLKPLQSQAAVNHQQLPSNFDYMDKLAMIPPSYKPEEGVDKIASNHKFAVDQENQPKDKVVSGYKSKEDQTVDQAAESVSQTAAFDYQRTSLPMTDHATNESEHRTSVSLNNVTQLGVTKLNVSDGNDTVVSAASKIANAFSKINESKIQSTTSKPLQDLEEPVFSLDSVLDLLFSSDKESNDPVNTRTPVSTTTSRSITKSTSEPSTSSSKSTKSTRQPVTEATTVTKVLGNEIPVSVASLLKLAGCNIYGRMYRVGRIIAELSGPCLECRCTEIGVQCKQLQC